MVIYSTVSIAATAVYIALLVVIILNRQWQKQHKFFTWYLVAASFWALSTFLLRSDFLMEHKLLLFRIVILASVWWTVQLYYFVRAFLNLSGGFGVRLGYISLATLAILAVLGYWPVSYVFKDGAGTPNWGWCFYLYIATLLMLTVLGLYVVAKRLKAAVEPKEHNKVSYLLVALLLLTAFGFGTILTPLGEVFPLSVLGALFAACIFAYAIIKHEMVSINLILRRVLAWAAIIAVAVSSYLALFFLGQILLGFMMETSTLVATTTAAAVIALVVFRLRSLITDIVDRLFYQKRYDYRLELSEFLRRGIRGVFSLQELSEKLLPPLVKALNSQQAYMLLPKTGSGDFVTEFSEPPVPDNPPLRIGQDSPTIEWLRRESSHLTIRQMDFLPEFRGLWEQEREELNNLGIELLFPLVSRSNLIGILALTKKQSGKYSLEDTNFVEGIATQVAISLEKEYLQEELRKREQELSLVSRLAGVITSSLNIQEVYDNFIAGLREVIEVDFATVALIDGNKIRFSALYDEVGSPWRIGDSLKYEGTATQWITRNKKSHLEPDLAQDSTFFSGKELLEMGIRSVVCLPLITKDEAIGSLNIASRHANVYSQEQINLLERLASQISTSVANAQLYARAEQRARIDELTGLFNRRHFDESIRREVERHSRHGSILSLVLLDLDNFKSYNDLAGHLVGDKLLARVGHLIRESLRNIDLAFRYGGDEFAIILPDTPGEAALAVTERVRSRVADDLGGEQVLITASLGLASWPNDGLAPDDITDAADQALYYAKQTGGNRTCTVSQILPSLTETTDSTHASEKETLNTIYALAATIEARDPYTYGHSRKVRAYAVALAESLGLSSERVAVVSHAALLHDIGKIGIIDGVLNKADKLDDKEWELIKSHPQLSRTIVGHIPSLTPCLPAILHHHERWDGEGYPSGLKGEAIPLEARILSIADAFDAMTSLRPYRAPLTYEAAAQELKRCAGSQFDPKLVDLFLSIALTISPEELGVR
jgi:diguanylate cyclase (GGDEF)-like protein